MHPVGGFHPADGAHRLVEAEVFKWLDHAAPWEEIVHPTGALRSWVSAEALDQVVEITTVAKHALQAVCTLSQLGHFSFVFGVFRSQQNVTALGSLVRDHGALEHLGHGHHAVLGVWAYDGSDGLLKEFALVDVELNLGETQVPDVVFSIVGCIRECFCVLSTFPPVGHGAQLDFHGFDVRRAGLHRNLHVADVSTLDLLVLWLAFVRVVVGLHFAFAHTHFAVGDVLVQLGDVLNFSGALGIDVLVLALDGVGVHRVGHQGVELLFFALGQDELLVAQQVDLALVGGQHGAEVLLPHGFVLPVAVERAAHVRRIEAAKQHLLELRVGHFDSELVVRVIQHDVGRDVAPHFVLKLLPGESKATTFVELHAVIQGRNALAAHTSHVTRVALSHQRKHRVVRDQKAEHAHTNHAEQQALPVADLFNHCHRLKV